MGQAGGMPGGAPGGAPTPGTMGQTLYRPTRPYAPAPSGAPSQPKGPQGPGAGPPQAPTPAPTPPGQPGQPKGPQSPGAGTPTAIDPSVVDQKLRVTGGVDPVPTGGATPRPGGIDHAGNFDQLMREDPFLARQYVGGSNTDAQNWYQKNQMGIASKYFGAPADWGRSTSEGWAPMNSWINDNSAGGGTWDRRGGNALDVRDPQGYARLRNMWGM